MNIRPSLEEILRISETNDYSLIPLSTEMLCDFTTPIETLKILKNISSHCFLLESAIADKRWGRYTFLGYDPRLEITCRDGVVSVMGMELETDRPSDLIRQILHTSRSPRFDWLPPFTGGLVGYFGFDYFGYAEPSARNADSSPQTVRDLDLMRFDRVICFDHLAQKLILIVNMDLRDPQTSYKKAVLELKTMKDLILHGEKTEEIQGRITGDITPLFSKEEFTRKVERARRHIYEGDIFQIVLSNQLSAPFEGSLLQTYRMLRTINPSPYMFYFAGDDIEVAGASPETLIRLENGIVHTFPLAGTRPRGADEEEDLALEKELLHDEKELAEHNMLVDLGRNDLGRICTFGSVEVEKLHCIERYSHVMHIGSTVRGKIRPELDALDAVEAVLPAGTLSGAPKIRACQLIHDLEKDHRGIYGGAIGYIDFAGSMDLCIAIRIAWARNGRVFVRSGAGIVADSDPDKEYQECLNKARGCLSALLQAQEGEA